MRLLLLALSVRLWAAERWELQYFYDKNDAALSFTGLEFASAARGLAPAVLVETNRRPKPMMALTADGGRTWELVSLREPAFSVFLLDEQRGWMVSVQGRLWNTTDGGRTWTRAALPGVRAEPVRAYFRDASRGWLLCSRKQVYATTDGGRSWSPLPDAAVPDLAEERSLYSQGAAFRDRVLLAGFMRPFSRRARFPVWMEPDLAAVGLPPTSSFLLHSSNGGERWSRHVLRSFGEIKRLRVSSSGAAYLLVHRIDQITGAPTEIRSLDWTTLATNLLYADRTRWVTDIAVAGAGKLFAVALDQEGRSAQPAIPIKLRVLTSSDARAWREMEVDYRAEAHSAHLSSPDPDHAWIATDTGMILRWVKE
jgi:photosystem II stability/assembly factor-like uncharacterized protein